MADPIGFLTWDPSLISEKWRPVTGPPLTRFWKTKILPLIYPPLKSLTTLMIVRRGISCYFIKWKHGCHSLQQPPHCLFFHSSGITLFLVSQQLHNQLQRWWIAPWGCTCSNGSLEPSHIFIIFKSFFTTSFIFIHSSSTTGAAQYFWECIKVFCPTTFTYYIYIQRGHLQVHLENISRFPLIVLVSWISGPLHTYPSTSTVHMHQANFSSFSSKTMYRPL